MGRPDLLVVGDANPDVLVMGAPAQPPAGQAETLVDAGVLALGGSAAIVAHGAARLGLSTALAAMVGRDAAGDFVLDTLATAGVDISACVRHETLPTALSVCLNQPGGDRSILTAPGCLPVFAPDELPEARHVHSASLFLQPALAARLPALFDRVRRTGGTTSLDTNDDPAGTWKLPAGLLAACDLLLPNDAEALRLAGRDGVPEAMRALAATGPVPVVKRGRRGAQALFQGELLTVRGTEVEPTDTVGAGDSFDAGFLAEWLGSGDLARSMALGCACGAMSTRAAGGTAAQPTREEASRFAAVAP
ncbi:carbohydrate kinase family protein [Streptomyces sp. NPDC005146]